MSQIWGRLLIKVRIIIKKDSSKMFVLELAQALMNGNKDIRGIFK